MWQGPGPSVHSWHTVGTQSVHRKTEGADGCAMARRCPFPPGAPPSGRAGRGGCQGHRIETSRMWTAKPSLFAQRVYPFTVERAEDRRRRKRSVRLLGRRARARPPGAWGGRRDVPGTCPAWGAPCPALSLQSPQADVIPPPRKDPPHTEPRAGLPWPVPRPCWKPLEGSSQNAGRPSQLTPPCPPASHHSSAESGPGALGCIKLQAFIECWLFAQLHTGHHGGFRSTRYGPGGVKGLAGSRPAQSLAPGRLGMQAFCTCCLRGEWKPPLARWSAPRPSPYPGSVGGWDQAPPGHPRPQSGHHGEKGCAHSPNPGPGLQECGDPPPGSPCPV